MNQRPEESSVVNDEVVSALCELRASSPLFTFWVPFLSPVAVKQRQPPFEPSLVGGGEQEPPLWVGSINTQKRWSCRKHGWIRVSLLRLKRFCSVLGAWGATSWESPFVLPS